jgi:hypothetical protein
MQLQSRLVENCKLACGRNNLRFTVHGCRLDYRQRWLKIISESLVGCKL